MKKAFTLIEIAVASGVFVLIVSLLVIGFLNLKKAQNLFASQLIAYDNLKFAMEKINREVRTGWGFSSLDNKQLNFCDRNGKPVKVYLEEDKIYYNNLPITDSNLLKITDLSFQLTETTSQNNNFSYITRVHYKIKGEIKKPTQIPFEFSQLIAPRTTLLNIQGSCQ